MTYLLKILTNAIHLEKHTVWKPKKRRYDWADNLGKKFSSSCSFPRDYAIPTRRLVNLCVAKELVEELNDTPKHVVMNYLSKLQIDLNLFMFFLRIWILYSWKKKAKRKKWQNSWDQKQTKKETKTKNTKSFGVKARKAS